MGYENFNDEFRSRTKQFAVDIVRFYSNHRKSDEFRILGKQLVRSGTSVASNFRAAARARSSKEFYAKVCIVVEEADETQFWLELMLESNLVSSTEIEPLQQEATEILAMVTKMKFKLQKR
jgi:four helix bundle protein